MTQTSRNKPDFSKLDNLSLQIRFLAAKQILEQYPESILARYRYDDLLQEMKRRSIA